MVLASHSPLLVLHMLHRSAQTRWLASNHQALHRMFSTGDAGMTMADASAGSCTDIETTIGDAEIATTTDGGAGAIAIGIIAATATKLQIRFRCSLAWRWGALPHDPPGFPVLSDVFSYTNARQGGHLSRLGPRSIRPPLSLKATATAAVTNGAANDVPLCAPSLSNGTRTQRQYVISV